MYATEEKSSYFLLLTVYQVKFRILKYEYVIGTYSSNAFIYVYIRIFLQYEWWTELKVRSYTPKLIKGNMKLSYVRSTTNNFRKLNILIYVK